MKKPIVLTLDTSVFSDGKKFKDAYALVSEERKLKVDALCTESDKRLSLGVGVLFEEGLKTLGIDDGTLRYGKNKKPYLSSADDVYFSLSHSGVMAVCAFYDKEIGIDIEKIRKVPDSVMQKVTTKTEYDRLLSFSEDERCEQFIRLWTAKESCAKYLGTGFSALSPRSIEMDYDNMTLTHNGKILDVITEEQTTDGYRMTMCYKKPKGE